MRLLAAAVVDAAPPSAIVRIAAEPVCLVNVVGVTVRIRRVPENRRDLACGKLVRLLNRHDGDISAFRLASGDGASERSPERNLQRDDLVIGFSCALAAGDRRLRALAISASGRAAPDQDSYLFLATTAVRRRSPRFQTVKKAVTSGSTTRAGSINCGQRSSRSRKCPPRSRQSCAYQRGNRDQTSP